eukprot:Nk52_evm85s62 gene=Nk52_evmTU85s62
MENRDFKNRFSLLILEPREIYLEDFSASLIHLNANGKCSKSTIPIKGRVRVCSKSLIFDPHDWKFPILKLLFKFCNPPRDANENVFQNLSHYEIRQSNSFIVESARSVELLGSNVIGAYKIEDTKRLHLFQFHHTSSRPVFDLVWRLVAVSGQSLLRREDMYKELVREKTSKLKFDMSWLTEVNEKIVVEGDCSLVAPLVANPGRMVLSCSHIYFQHLNNILAEPVTKLKLSLVCDIRKRRYLLRHTGIEVFFMTTNLTDVKNHSSSSLSPAQYTEDENVRPPSGTSKDSTSSKGFYFSHFFVFDTTSERDRVYLALLDILPQFVKITEISEQSLNRLTKRWQNGKMSNYSYLMELNNFAGRTFNDLTQYPVFPWIISDYTSETLDLSSEHCFRDLSKPIGALNPERLRGLKERFKEMPEPKFLYGAHYSAPGYVLNFLVRSYPEYMLCLQNGKFDSPNRLFHSILDTWTSVLNSPTDVKELIPEFYGQRTNFLKNELNLQLGVRHDGTRVGDVILPPWAKTPEEFLSICRSALESDYVSRHIHEWIDLIFGYKQRGIEAISSDNIFFHLTYEGAVDLNAIKDPIERAAIEEQINEFGQIPTQLFTQPHPVRNLCALASHDGPDSHTSSTTDVRLIDSFAPSEEEENALNLLNLYDSFSKNVESDRLSSERPTSVDRKSSCNAIGLSTCPFSRICSLCHFQDLRACRVTINDICCTSDSKSAFLACQDGYLRMINIADMDIVRTVSVCDLSLASCCLSSDENIVVAGSWDNCVYFYSLKFGRVLCQWDVHDDAVSVVNTWHHLLFTGSWDGSVKVWNYSNAVNALGGGAGVKDCFESFVLEMADHETEISCVIPHSDGDLFLSAAKDGTVILSSVSSQCAVAEKRLTEAPCNSLSFSGDGNIALLGFENGSVFCCVVPDFDIIFASEVSSPVVGSCFCGGYVFACSDRITVWDLTNGDEVYSGQGFERPASCLAVCGNGNALVGMSDGTVSVFNCNPGNE